MSTLSTYMGFPISTINVDSGLNWETNLNAALTAIDAHNHSPGQGQQIQPNGLNLTSDLTFQSNNAIALRATRFTPQGSPIPNSGSDVGELYVSGNELFYNDATGGNQVQMTLNGSVNATSSGISSGTATAAFSTGTLVVKSSSSSFGNVALQSVILANSGNLVNQLTLQAPALSGSYALTLPAVPGSTSFMTLDASGNMAAATALLGALTHSNLSSSAAILGTQLSSSANILGTQLDAAAGIIPPQTDSLTGVYWGQSAGSSTFTSSSTSFVNVTGMNASSTAGLVTTRPVFVSFMDDASGGASSGSISISSANLSSICTFIIIKKNGITIGGTLATFTFALNPGGNNEVLTIPVSSLNCIDVFPDGIHPQYQLQVKVGNALDTVSVTRSIMQVVQV